MKRKHNERTEKYRDEEREVIERGLGTRRDPEHLQHATWQHWANEKHSHGQRGLNEKHRSFFEEKGLTILGRTPKRFI